MSLLAQGIAHVSFPGGGTFLPLRNASDRRRLIADIANHSRAGDPVQLLVEEQRWVIRPQQVSSSFGCAVCGITEEPAAFSQGDEQTGYCITCVLAPCARSSSSDSADDAKPANSLVRSR